MRPAARRARTRQAPATLAPALLLQMFEVMTRIRLFEQKAKELFLQGRIRGTLHLSIGEEGTSAGAGLALNPDDYIMTTHRGHGHALARGTEPGPLLAEIMGKRGGLCEGRGGSMHIFDVPHGVLGANAIVAGGIPLATGVALALQMRRAPQVILCFFGDGAANEGEFHESLNIAAVWKLPVVYLCVNNQVADTTPYHETIAIENIADRAGAYGMPGSVVDGNDAIAVYQTVRAAAERARAGAGPTLIECKTYRWEGHHLGDPQVYRTKEEVEAWKLKDPILRLRRQLIADGAAEEVKLDALHAQIAGEIEEAVQYAMSSPEPAARQALDFVWAS
jgi:TPP-dependent pyruvate/acetoin dehydrogenase alpha subunit